MCAKIFLYLVVNYTLVLHKQVLQVLLSVQLLINRARPEDQVVRVVRVLECI